MVDYVTRMPEKFEAHIKLAGFTENFNEVATDKRYSGHQLSASLGNKQGVLWWVNLNRMDSDSHPLVFTE